MPITSSARKALRSSKRKRLFNVRRKDALKQAVKAVQTAATEGSTDAQGVLSKAYKAIDKAAKRGVIKKNTASRKKSRLSKLLNKSST